MAKPGDDSGYMDLRQLEREDTRRIVFAVDASEHSSVAVRWACASFIKPEDRVSLLTIYSDTRVDEMGRVIPGANQPVSLKVVVSQAHTIQKCVKMQNEIHVHGVSSLSTEQAIKKFTRYSNPSFLVVGSRALTKVERHLLGSVSDFCIHHSRCPVLVVKVKDEDLGKEFESGRRLKAVMGVDKSGESESAVNWFLGKFGDSIDLQLVNVGRSKKTVDLESEQVLKDYATNIKMKLGIDVDTLSLRGKPGKAISEHCTACGADLVLIGSRGHGQMKRHLLGSVSDYVVHNVNIPVFVYKEPDLQEKAQPRGKSPKGK